MGIRQVFGGPASFLYCLHNLLQRVFAGTHNRAACSRPEVLQRCLPLPVFVCFTTVLVLPPPLCCSLQLCAGAIRSKNTMNILLQTVLDAAVSAICWYLIG